MRKFPWLPVVIALGLLGGIVLFWDTSEKKQEPQTQGIKANTTNTPPETHMKNTISLPTDITIDRQKDYQAILATSKGEIVIDLMEKEVPMTVNNFAYLADNNFYDGTIFHRVIKGFMIQGGDPKGDGTGGPGYRFDDERLEGEYIRGVVAMANAGPDTNGSQFFIMDEDHPLPNNYVIFGKVISGIEVVDAIANVEVTTSPMGEASKPIEPVVVRSVRIQTN